MKARPRYIENEIAARLTEQFLSLGFSPVERIPVLGRTGPDITINESGLAVDVKSRLEVPLLLWKCFRDDYRAFPDEVVRRRYNGDVMLCVQVRYLPKLYSYVLTSEHPVSGSKLVSDWLLHMAEWTEVNGGIPMIVCHRPRMNTANAVCVIFEKDLQVLQSKLEVRIVA